MTQQELTDQLISASQAYYSGHPIMTDRDFDQKLNELRMMEERTGIVYKGSPTVHVGAVEKNQLQKVEHEFPALSLDKTKDIDILVNEFESSSKKEYCVMPKMDGCTLQLTYDGGSLIRAVTRGTGLVGSDVTANAHYISGIPDHISFARKLVVRGEVVMHWEDFDRLNQSSETGAMYKNPRNAASAILMSIDPMDIQNKPLHFYAFELVYIDDPTGSVNRRFSGRMQWLSNERISTVICNYTKDLRSTLQQMSDEAPRLLYPVDGLVVVHDDVEWASQLMGTMHHPHHMKGFALKWKDDVVETTLRSIEWQLSRTGLLNPVAVFDPVDLEGTTVSRASLFNLSYIRSKELRPGNRITVYKANKVIPAVADNLDYFPFGGMSEQDIYCPCCGQKATIVTEHDISTAHCKNPECEGTLVGKFSHFCERESMNIRGLSDETLKKLIDHGYLNEFSDLYQLSSHRNEIAKIDGLSAKIVDKLLAAIDQSRFADLTSLLTALGIPNLGKGQARVLATNFGSLESIAAYRRSEIDFTRIKGIGPIVNQSILDYFTMDRVMDILYETANTDIGRLLKELRVEEEKPKEALPLSGQKFAVSGSLDNFPNRLVLYEIIRKNGGIPQDVVRKDTTYLICNDPSVDSSKIRKAINLDIPIINETLLIALLNGHDGLGIIEGALRVRGEHENVVRFFEEEIRLKLTTPSTNICDGSQCIICDEFAYCNDYKGPAKDWKTKKSYGDGCSFIFSNPLGKEGRLCLNNVPELQFEGESGFVVDIDKYYDDDDEERSIGSVDICQKGTWTELKWSFLVEEYDVDIRLHGWNQTSETEHLLDIRRDGTVINQMKTYDDWLWECPNAQIAKEE